MVTEIPSDFLEGLKSAVNEDIEEKNRISE